MKIKQGVFNRNGLELNSVEIELEGTTLIMLEGYGAFFMCGALDVDIYKDREVLCGKAVKVKTLDDLFNATIFDSTKYAKSLGIVPGLKVYEAFEKIRLAL
ncbi:MAG: DUF1805 domain-containing protein [Roseburia sp.]|nr:DUF1805 domain-containing protein [Anaeroplasma bactoclasticum]MCM1196553.1 DUF1805 domain-containing protein [Roseburia sp.]MCM1557624.1 DUF1805 domain-containing protein [Anaeroplasma bactoclasticum]